MDKSKLLKILRERLSTDEFEDACFELGVPAEDFPGGKAEKFRRLISYLEYRNRLNDLILWLTGVRPDIDLTDVLDLPKSQYDDPVVSEEDEATSGRRPVVATVAENATFSVALDNQGCRGNLGIVTIASLLVGIALALYVTLGVIDPQREFPNVLVTITSSPTSTAPPPPTNTPTRTPAPSRTPTLTTAPTRTSTATGTPTQTATPTSVATSTATAEPAEEAETPTPAVSATPAITPTASPTGTATATLAPTATRTPSPTATATPPAGLELPPATGTNWDRPRDRMRMSFISGGEFEMGRVADGVVRQPLPAIVEDYWIDQTEVTLAMYAICVQSGNCTPAAPSFLLDELERTNRLSPGLPVVQVSWQQARTYCGWVGGDLPSEAQWEYTAGSEPFNTVATFPWEAQSLSSEELCEFAQFEDCGPGGGRPWAPNAVPAKRAGATDQRVFDLAGNVFEWTLDGLDFASLVASLDEQNGEDTAAGAVINPVAPDYESAAAGDPTRRIIKGGSYVNSAKNMRAQYRSFADQTHADDTIGFRCVIPADSE